MRKKEIKSDLLHAKLSVDVKDTREQEVKEREALTCSATICLGSVPEEPAGITAV